MAEDVFPGIEFALPAQGKLDAAREIGERCGTIWYTTVNQKALPPGYPDSTLVATHPRRLARGVGQGMARREDCRGGLRGAGA